MNLESLRYFQMITKEGNISGVAKKVHLSQSALSQQIQKLENDLSRKLMIRSNKGITLTNTGVIVSKFADNILRTYEEMLNEIEQAEDDNIFIKIEGCTWFASYALPCSLIKAKKTYPNHNYELSGNVSDEILSNVANNICDIGFYCGELNDFNNKELVASKVGENNVVLVAKNITAYPDRMTMDEFLEASLILYSEKNNITKILKSTLNKMGYRQNINCSMRVEEIESAKKLVANGYGMAFLPYITVKEELYKKQFKLVQIPELHINIDIYMLRKADCPNTVQDFVRWFKSNGKESFC